MFLCFYKFHFESSSMFQPEQNSLYEGAGECAGIVEGKVGVAESMVRRKVKWEGRGG